MRFGGPGGHLEVGEGETKDGEGSEREKLSQLFMAV